MRTYKTLFSVQYITIYFFLPIFCFICPSQMLMQSSSISGNDKVSIGGMSDITYLHFDLSLLTHFSIYKTRAVIIMSLSYHSSIPNEKILIFQRHLCVIYLLYTTRYIRESHVIFLYRQAKTFLSFNGVSG